MPMKDRLCGFAAFAALLAVTLPLGSAVQRARARHPGPGGPRLRRRGRTGPLGGRRAPVISGDWTSAGHGPGVPIRAGELQRVALTARCCKAPLSN